MDFERGSSVEKLIGKVTFMLAFSGWDIFELVDFVFDFIAMGDWAEGWVIICKGEFSFRLWHEAGAIKVLFIDFLRF